MDLGLLSGLAQGFQQGFDSYRTSKAQAEEKARLAALDRLAMKKQGFELGEDGAIAETQEAKKQRAFDEAIKQAGLLKSGYQLGDYDSEANRYGLLKVPGHKDADEDLKRAQAEFYRRKESGSGKSKDSSSEEHKGKSLPAGSAESQGQALASLGSLDVLEKSIEDRQELFGPTRGLISKGKALFEIGKEGELAKVTESDLKRTAQEIGKYLEGGKLAAGDDIKYRAMLPNIGDSPQVAKAKLQGVRELIQRKQKGELESLRASGYEVQGLLKNLQPTANANDLSSIKKESISPDQALAELERRRASKTAMRK